MYFTMKYVAAPKYITGFPGASSSHSYYHHDIWLPSKAEVNAQYEILVILCHELPEVRLQREREQLLEAKLV